ncbi:hypothetical protein [Vibrio natriegens]|uniref:hypothetical protein n=1 Tax=Vibrio natriegens TaxID=691 RepID=UPI003B59CD0B
MITVVPGGILFTADLVRQLSFDISMDYIYCPHPPGERNNSSEIVYHHNINVIGRNVILIDDAIESGGTIIRDRTSNRFRAYALDPRCRGCSAPEQPEEERKRSCLEGLPRLSDDF